MTRASFQIRRAEPTDRREIERLVCEMHGVNVSKRFDWIYASNPHGEAQSWIAVDTETGHAQAVTSIFPRRVIVDGVERLGAVGGDCFVALAARRQGLATRLHEATRRDLGGAGVEFMYGPPLENNLRALEKAGTTPVTVFKRYVRPLSQDFLKHAVATALPQGAGRLFSNSAAQRVLWTALAALGGGSISLDRSINVEHSAVFGAEWDTWVATRYPARGVFCVRDSAYLNFRHGSGAPGGGTPYAMREDGELCGMFVLSLSPDGIQANLIDFFASITEPGTRKVLREAARKAVSLGAGVLQIQATPHSLLHKALRAEGFWERDRSDPWVFQVLSPDGTSDRSTLNGINSWFFLGADQDLG